MSEYQVIELTVSEQAGFSLVTEKAHSLAQQAEALRAQADALNKMARESYADYARQCVAVRHGDDVAAKVTNLSIELGRDPIETVAFMLPSSETDGETNEGGAH